MRLVLASGKWKCFSFVCSCVSVFVSVLVLFLFFLFCFVFFWGGVTFFFLFNSDSYSEKSCTRFQDQLLKSYLYHRSKL